MNAGRPGTAGATRTCPHCRATILQSAAICPACRHHLRFEPGTSDTAAEVQVPLRVEGSIRPPAGGDPWEYSVTVSIRDERGQEVGRHVVGVGAIQPDEQRSFTLEVEMTPTAAPGRRRGLRH